MIQRRPPRPVSFGPVLMLAAACGGPPEQPEPVELAGCHYFEQDQAARDLRLPWGVRLLDEPLTGWPALAQRQGVRRALTLTAEGAADVPFGYWIPTGPDSIEIGYPAGGGLLLELAPRDGRLVGIARPVGDALPFEPAAARPADRPVTLIRARCPGG